MPLKGKWWCFFVGMAIRILYSLVHWRLKRLLAAWNQLKRRRLIPFGMSRFWRKSTGPNLEKYFDMWLNTSSVSRILECLCCYRLTWPNGLTWLFLFLYILSYLLESKPMIWCQLRSSSQWKLTGRISFCNYILW